MTDAVLFHHAQGLTPGIQAFAYQLGASGNNVRVPDLYDGMTFQTLEEGVAHAEQIGFEELISAGEQAVEELAAEVVYAGFSVGAMIAHKLAQNRPGALGAVLYHHGDVPITTFGETWPEGVDVQIHVNEDDEFCDMDVVEEFVEKAGEKANAELYTYPGAAHLFADFSLSDYDPESAELVLQRTLDFLASH
jgi:dienelactone hydrolase